MSSLVNNWHKTQLIKVNSLLFQIFAYITLHEIMGSLNCEAQLAQNSILRPLLWLHSNHPQLYKQ